MSEKMKLLYRPEVVSPPGETLRDLLEERGMTQADLVERTGRPTKTINEIIQGKTAITPETALQLERVTGVPAEFWNQREADYRAYLARKKELQAVSEQELWLKQFPLKEMIRRGLIKKYGTVAESVISILNYFGVANVEQWSKFWISKKLAFKKSLNLDSNVGSIAVWLRQGEIEGEKIQCKPYDRTNLINLLPEIRDLTNISDPNISLIKLQEICAACGVAVVFIKPLPKVPIFGVSSWLSPDKALVQLSLRLKTADILWFSIFHEIGHILKHGKKDYFVDLDSKLTEKDEKELEADKFAEETLIPSAELNSWLSKNKEITVNSILSFSNLLGIMPGILVGRLQHKGIIAYSDFNKLKFKYDFAEK